MWNRRQLLQAMAFTAAAHSLPGVALASADTEKRFVLVVLRGAVDGLALVPPYGDGRYRSLRGELALDNPGTDHGALKLDGLFGLHPALVNLHSRFEAREALVVHAVASPYRERSHFDGQDLLESGAAHVGDLRDGWLNRALAPLRSGAIALAQNTPLVLRGDNAVTSWAPSRLPDADEDTIARLKQLYAGDEFFSSRLEAALRAQEIAQGMDSASRRSGGEARQFRELSKSAARFLAADDGPRIAVLEVGGWDTHANQGAATGQLANRLRALDAGLEDLRNELGTAWNDTVVAVVTEFGRTVRVNGTRGSDHGTGTAALLVGGAVDGGRVVSDWPGLERLHEGRDLMPTTDLRSVLKGVLEQHLRLAPAFIEREVFPASGAAAPLDQLIHA